MSSFCLQEKVKVSDKEKERQEASRRRIEMARKAPPPVDFQTLLKMANEKKGQPVKIEKPKKEVKEAEFGGRPMTKKEKEEYMREHASRLRREGKLPPKVKTLKNDS